MISRAMLCSIHIMAYGLTPTSSASRAPATRPRRPWCARARRSSPTSCSRRSPRTSPTAAWCPSWPRASILRAIVPVVRKALADAGQTYQSIDAMAVTQGPGLAGALLVGISYAKALAFALDKPLIAVNHLEGHIHAVLLEERQKGNHELQFPGAGAGGLRRAHSSLSGRAAGRTAGPTRTSATRATTPPAKLSTKSPSCWAWDIPAARSSTSFPPHGDPTAVKFPPAQLKHRDRNDRRQPTRTRDGEPRFDFSYSGIKTAVLRYVETHDMQHVDRSAAQSACGHRQAHSSKTILRHCDQQTLDLVASFQRAMVEDLVGKTLAAARDYDVATLFVTGGVAANQRIAPALRAATLPGKVCPCTFLRVRSRPTTPP